MKINKFPYTLFFIYVLFYAGQAVYYSYFNLYLDSVGLNKTAIGLFSSITAAIPLFANPLWGVLSDRAKSKNGLLLFVTLCSAFIPLAFYISRSFLFIIVVGACFSLFYNVITILQDNLSMEYLEGSKWDFGKIRMGGTLGFAVTAGIVGFLINNQYNKIFYMFAILMLLSCLLLLKIPNVAGQHKSEEKVSPKVLFTNTPLLCLIILNIIFSVGANFSNTFYPIYFTSIGGNSQYVGILAFTGAMAEVPFLLTSNRLFQRFRLESIMVASVFVSALRLLLLYLVTNPVLILIINLLQGFTFISFYVSMVVYINTKLPKGIRATGLVLNSLISTLFSGILFGPIGGWACDAIGIRPMILLVCLFVLAAAMAFVFVYPHILHTYEKKSSRVPADPSTQNTL